MTTEPTNVTLEINPKEESGKLPEASFEYDGDESTLFRIWLINLLLKIVTFGFYTFWGRTRMRQFLWSSFLLKNDRLEYTGTGWELFRSFLITLPLILLLYVPLVIGNHQKNPYTGLLWIPILFLIFSGIYSAMRYRLLRTSWRGVRGFLCGSALKYGAMSMLYTILSLLTLSLARPFFDAKLAAYMFGNVQFGDQKATFTESSVMPLFKSHVLTLLLAFITFGISRFWYRAALARYTFGNIEIGGLRFQSTQTGIGLAGLKIGNFFIMLITLGLGKVITIQRTMRFISDTFHVLGDVDALAVRQAEHRSTQAEGLASVFDIDIGFI